MEDIGSLTGVEMMARRDATEKKIAALIGQLVFFYSRFVTDLHLCVAWHDDGRELGTYGSKAENLAAADLIKRIEVQAKNRLGEKSSDFKKYKDWARRAHVMRELRNILMHSRWSIEPYGRHAIALTTPIFVEPVKELTFTPDQLKDVCSTCDSLIRELYKLREEFPL